MLLLDSLRRSTHRDTGWTMQDSPLHFVREQQGSDVGRQFEVIQPAEWIPDTVAIFFLLIA